MNPVSNTIIQSLWISGPLSNSEILGIYSYLKNGHEYHLYTYEDIKNVPKGAIVKDGNEILPHECIFKDSSQSFAAFADWFRFKLLYLKGGWWVDIDTVCLRYFDIESNYCFSSEYDDSGSALLNATYMKSRSQSPFLKECLDYIDGKNRDEVKFGEFGLLLLRKVLAKYECMGFIKAPEVFCPINWFEMYHLISSNEYKPENITMAIHLWNERWRLALLNKNATYHPHSIYERLKRKYST